ncbi:MAG: hypothetical protein EA391_00195 [Balneolaceae bacterium]|nr:MAG: hypothetical protein EA391_00195 [Balneolaceae bacterium]
MKTYIKNLLSITLLTSFLLLGLVAGNSTAIAFDEGPYNGFVCPDDDDKIGICDPNHNATTCTWGPGGICTTAPATAPGEHP